jgi:uncharacterized membrane protein
MLSYLYGISTVLIYPNLRGQRLQLTKNIEKAKPCVKSLLTRIEKNADKLILVPIVIYTIFFSAYTCYLHYTFRTYAWDLGIISQSLWTTLNTDKMLYSTLEVFYGNPSGNFLGVHFSPILLIILPIYYLFQSPETLLIFQSFILAIAVLPLYWIARDKLQNKLFALAFATAYLLNPALHGVNTFDFHLEIFTPVFILFAFYYIDKAKWLKAIPFIILELTTLEFAPLLILSLGFYFFIKRLRQGFSKQQSKLKTTKKLVPCIMLMLLAIFSFYLSLYVIETINPLKTGGAPGRWDYWGSNVFEVATNVIRNPIEAITVIITPLEKIYFVIFLCAAALFLPVFAPLELIMWIPWVIFALLTDYIPYYQPYYQYSAFVIGQIFIAGIYGFKTLYSSHTRSKIGNREKKVVLGLVVSNLLLLATISPIGIPVFTERTPRPYSISTAFDSDHVEQLHRAINLLPANASVATLWDTFPHVCQRSDAYFLDLYFLEMPEGYPAEYILIDMKSPTLEMRIYGITPIQVILTLLENKEYGIIASLDGVMLLKRDYQGPIEYYEPQKDTFNYKKLVPSHGKITWNYTGTFHKVISGDLQDSIGITWFGPYQYFTPGTYEAIFRIKTMNETCNLVLDIVTEKGTKVVALRSIYGDDFEQTDNWKDFSLNFEIDKPAELEFRGKCFENNTQIVLDCITVKPLQP